MQLRYPQSHILVTDEVERQVGRIVKGLKRFLFSKSNLSVSSKWVGRTCV
jgi:hypothetical protein